MYHGNDQLSQGSCCNTNIIIIPLAVNWQIKTSKQQLLKIRQISAGMKLGMAYMLEYNKYKSDTHEQA